MLRSLFVALLFLSTVALCQPLEGPWLIYSSPETAVLSTPRAVTQAGGAKLLFVQQIGAGSSHLYAGDFSFATHQASNVQPVATGGYMRITDALPNGEQGWFAAVTDELDSARGYLLTEAGTAQLYADVWHGHPWYGGSHMIDCHLAPRIGGGVVVMGEVETAWGWEGDFWAYTYLFPANSLQPDWSDAFMPFGYLSQSYGYSAISTYRDSVALLTQSGRCLWSFLPPATDSMPRQVPLLCPEIKSLGQLQSGELRALAYDSMFKCVAPTFDGTCLELGLQARINRNILATAWHPRLGFAILQADSATLYLARMDTNGQTVQSSAIFQQIDPEFRVSDGGLLLADNTVYVIWSERDYRQPGVSRVQIASVGWSTILAAHDPHAVGPPSSFTLSAIPNPFNGQTRISFTIPSEGKVRLEVFGVLGKHIATLQNGALTAGEHSLLFDAAMLGSGVYFVRLQMSQRTVMQKLLLVK